MLPVYLSIEGLYSYQQKQEIDFTRLTEAGLFGIFGKVGSGKSTIIEAISFALYGETERLNKQEKRTYNMLNLKSEGAHIVFDFLNYQNRKFRFVARWKRRKRFEETTTLERIAYEWRGDSWVPMESADAGLVTNLSYPNFRRTIIIPQGQFKEFLELRGKDRSEMMKEIFNLDRFDLGPKVSALQKKNNSLLEHLKGALSGFESVSMEVLAAKQEELASAQKTLAAVRAETSVLEQEIARLTEGRRLRADLAIKQQEAAKLLNEQAKIDTLEKDLNIYERTSVAFREILHHTQQLNKEKEQLTFKIETLTGKKQDILSQLEQQEQEWENIVAEYLRLDAFKAESDDLQLLVGIAQNRKLQASLNKRIADGQPHLLRVQEEEKKLLEAIGAKESELESLKNSKIDTSILLALESWYQTDEHLSAQIEQLGKQADLLRGELAEIASIFDTQGLAIDAWEALLLDQEDQWNTALIELQHEETQLQVQTKLAAFAHDLVEGQACPLCGSLDHPSPMIMHDLHLYEKDLTDRRSELRNNLRQLKEKYQQLMQASTRWKEKNEQVEQVDSAHMQLLERRSLHRQQFSWDSFSATDKTLFLSYKDKNKLEEQHIKRVEQTLKDARSQLQDTQLKIEKYRNSLNEFEQRMAVTAGLIQQSEAQLRILTVQDFALLDETQLLYRKLQVEEKVRLLEDSHKRLSESIQQLKTNFAHINGERSAAKEQFQQLYQQLSARQAEISALLKEHGFGDIMQVQQILQRNIDIDSTKKVIQEFHVRLDSLSSQIADLEKRVAEDQFDEVTFEEKMNLHSLKREELELQIRFTGALEKECARLQVEFAKKEKLLDAYEKLNLRKSNLTTLENLFRGSGFVNYVSSIHLQRLCEIANVRFHRLTRNKLSLTVNENNEFEVVDFLNNGFRRSVKTLSGGQSFQASLCLALALAENVQSLNKADKNFFFIDEGFGTQDAESINVVFETLQYLHKERRIVGIISHVEELKERIPRAVTVVNDVNNGSQLHYVG
ncbi:exonuclease SbcC [Sphingobacterium allocomposti]|uniref:Exonuclease SbcC n=1 Tax=Sphingobacterium allocomposti TaxID=415956 RepID=A0A5S5DMQ5_9SPHI|nr:AAA family ATPase [Sphingobacterium composti Yoo et al. 2007 non Ten et al. 2007]TYP97220.1 exonuclease SbcC [Sphingobacterium composti Yoo et al. 2007 non Ten et al. 2007]